MTTTKKDLWRMLRNTESGLMVHVIEDILNICSTDEEVQSYLQKVYENGGQSGAITSLIYHHECEEFVKQHLTEVLDIYNEAKEFLDPKEEINVDKLAWMAYYETVVNIILGEENIQDFHM